MNPSERTEAVRVGGALVLCVLDGDAEGASALLEGSSFQVIAQACTDLARWLVNCIECDPAKFRAELAGHLQRVTEDDWEPQQAEG